MPDEPELGTHPQRPLEDASQLPPPSLQPATTLEPLPRFSSTAICWWNNGIWGTCGYAIPNDGGKPTTKNTVLHALHQFMGRELFQLMHLPDVQFRRPPNAEWLHLVVKMIRLGRKRILDKTIGWTDERTGDRQRSTNNVKAFMVYPVPFFGGRIRNDDARMWCEEILNLLGEVMQHPDNGYDGDVTNFLTSVVDKTLWRIQYTIATKFLGFSRTQAEDPTFVLPDITKENYQPDNLFTLAEMTDERPPDDWWPTINDLSAINGVPADVARAYAMRWPLSGTAFLGDQGSHETAFPGGPSAPSRVPAPGSRAAE